MPAAISPLATSALLPTTPEKWSDEPLYDVIYFHPDPLVKVQAPIYEIPIDQIKKRRSDGKVLSLPLGIGVGFRFQQEVYLPTDDAIKDDPLRIAATRRIVNASGEAVSWLETGGLTEIGIGLTVGFPLLPFPGHMGGIGLNMGGLSHNMAIYRVLKPYAGKTSAEIDQLLESHRFQFPAQIQAAKNLPLGSEYEVTGQTTLREDVAVGLKFGPCAGPLTAGFGISFGADGSSTHLGSIRVTALDGKNKVRILIRDLTQVILGKSVSASTGLLAGAGSLARLPYGATSKYVAEQQGFHHIEGLITWYTSMTFKLSQKDLRQDTALCSFDFDLSQPDLKEAYENLFHLDLNAAMAKAMKPGSGVQLVKLQEHETSTAKSGTMGFLGQKVLFDEVSKMEINGSVQEHDHFLLYRDRCFKKSFSSLLTASKEVEWQQVRICKKGETDFQEYFHFRYARVDQSVEQKDVDSFLLFAKTMAISLTGDADLHVGDVPFFKKVLTQEGQITFNLDIYFNQMAVKKIETVDKMAALQAYLRAAIEITPIYADFPLASEIRDAYHICKRKRSVLSPGRAGLLDKLEIEYRKRTGRSVSVDEALYRQAEKFAERLDKIKHLRNSADVTPFFTSLGESKQFNYMESIVALKYLVGSENCLVHRFSLAGNGAKLTAADEGFIPHPKDEAYAAMYEPLPSPRVSLAID